MAGKSTRSAARSIQASSPRKSQAPSQSPPRRLIRVIRGHSHDIADGEGKNSSARSGKAARVKAVEEFLAESENLDVEQGMQKTGETEEEMDKGKGNEKA